MLICHRDQTIHGKTRKALAAPNFVSMVQTSSALVPQLYGSQQELDLLQRLVTFPCNLRLPEKGRFQQLPACLPLNLALALPVLSLLYLSS